MYLLNTNLVSEVRKPNPHGAVVAWLESVPDVDLHLCAVTISEIQISHLPDLGEINAQTIQHGV